MGNHQLKAYKIWVPCTHTILKVCNAIFNKSNHIEQVTIHGTDEDDLTNLWENDIPAHFTPIKMHTPVTQRSDNHELLFATIPPGDTESEKEARTRTQVLKLKT